MVHIRKGKEDTSEIGCALLCVCLRKPSAHMHTVWLSHMAPPAGAVWTQVPSAWCAEKLKGWYQDRCPSRLWLARSYAGSEPLEGVKEVSVLKTSLMYREQC